jgi:hypothetical protein
MRNSVRLAVSAAALALPFVVTAPAFAAADTVVVQVPTTDHCVYASGGSVQYNNGDPTMQPAYAYADSCAFPGR